MISNTDYMDAVFTRIETLRVVPVITIDAADNAERLGDALVSGGLPIAEITLRTPAAEEAIRALAKSGQVLVGAGTILNIETAKRAADAGASFLVTPGFSVRIVEYCLSNGITIIPGASTATDLQAASEMALPAVKFFPAESIGGLTLLKSLAAPFANLRFMPTGGITPRNLRSYLDYPAVLACGGSWIATREAIAGNQFDEIGSLAATAVSLAAGSIYCPRPGG